MLAWSELAVHAGHLDDVLACVAGVVALRLLARHPVAAAAVLGLAVDAKPWALGFAALLLAVPRDRRLRAVVVWAGVVGVAWLPFVLADPGTLATTHFTIVNSSASALRALGVEASRTPGWDRPVQLLLGLALGLVAVRRGRTVAVLLVVVATRMALDPSTYNYYTSGLLVGTVAVDLLLLRGRWAWCTPAAFVAVYTVRNAQHLGSLTVDHLLGLERLVALVSLVAVALLATSRRATTPSRVAAPGLRTAQR